MRYKWLHQGAMRQFYGHCLKKESKSTLRRAIWQCVQATSAQSHEMIVHSLLVEGQHQWGEVRARSDDVASRPAWTTRPCWEIISGDLAGIGVFTVRFLRSGFEDPRL